MGTELIERKLNKKKVAGAIILLVIIFLIILNSIILHARKRKNETYVDSIFNSQQFEKQVGKETIDEDVTYGYYYKAKYPSTTSVDLNLKILAKEQEIKNNLQEIIKSRLKKNCLEMFILMQ